MDALHLTVETPTGEVIIRQGDALPPKEPRKVIIFGVIESPVEYLKKRIGAIDQLHCMVTVDRDKMTIELVVREHDHYADFVSGSLSLHPDFVKLGINSGKYRTAIEMAEFFKMNRALFENRQEAMNLVQLLRNFKAKVDKQVEADFNPNKGDKRILVARAVDSNIPASFKVCLPIFKGAPKQTIEVETYFNPDDLTCTLVSPQANEDMADFKDREIDRVVGLIRKIAPDIVIIEQ
jgi:hypothetical protein